MVWRWDVIARLCREHGLARGAEIGVADGRFSRAILSAIPDLHLTCVDFWPTGYKTWMGTEWTGEMQRRNRAAFMRMAGEFLPRLAIIEAPSLDAAQSVLDGSLDFVFIDADHSYEAVKADIGAWSPKVRAGGFITGHDYDSQKFPGVIRAVNEFFPSVVTQEDYVWMAQKA